MSNWINCDRAATNLIRGEAFSVGILGEFQRSEDGSTLTNIQIPIEILMFPGTIMDEDDYPIPTIGMVLTTLQGKILVMPCALVGGSQGDAQGLTSIEVRTCPTPPVQRLLEDVPLSVPPIEAELAYLSIVRRKGIPELSRILLEHAKHDFAIYEYSGQQVTYSVTSDDLEVIVEDTLSEYIGGLDDRMKEYPESFHPEFMSEDYGVTHISTEKRQGKDRDVVPFHRPRGTPS